MGLSTADVQILASLHHQGVSFRKTVTLGRQWLVRPFEELAGGLLRGGLPAEKVNELRDPDLHLKYADPLLRLLGAESVDALDYSDYEGATILHDLNAPLPDRWKQQFDMVIDGGTLEYVFNVPEGFRSLMELAKVGGYVYTAVPANNLCGHGFYQFSPELMYRVFSPDNGFAVEGVYYYESFHRVGYKTGKIVRVLDPAVLGFRSILDVGNPVIVVLVARRTAAVPIFVKPPLQSDYVNQWEYSAKTGERGLRKGGSTLTTRFSPAGLRRYLERAAPGLMSVWRTFQNPLHDQVLFEEVGR